MNHGGIQHLSKQTCKDIPKPHCFTSFHRYCNIIGLCGTQRHIILLPITPISHGIPQTKATPIGSLPVHNAPYPIRINISMQSHVNTGIISKAISNYALQVSQHMLLSFPMYLSWMTHKLAKCTRCIENI
jgi:hypothetical protein